MLADFGLAEGALIAASLIASVRYFTVYLGAAPSLAKTACKTTAAAALAVLAACAGAPGTLVFALTASALGDLFISRDGEAAFRAGLISFLAAHIAYVALFWSFASPLAFDWRAVAALAVLAYAVVVLRWLWPHLGAMRPPVAAYVAAIGAMGLTALAVPPALWPVLLGAGLFMLSDTALAAETFVFREAPRRWTAPVIWSSYYAAQLLIAAPFVIASPA